MPREVTILLDSEVYEGLERTVGRDQIGPFLNELARPHAVRDDLDDAYREMAADEEREREAREWVESVLVDVADEPR